MTPTGGGDSIGSVSVKVTGDWSGLKSDFQDAQDFAAKAGQGMADAFSKGATDAGYRLMDLSDALKEVEERARQVDDSLDGFTSLGSRLQKVGLALSIGITAPIVAMGTAALEAGGKLEQTEVAFTGLLKSGEKAAAFLEQLKQFAATTPFEFPELTNAAKRMLALGFSAEQLIPTLKTIGDAAAGLGAGAEGVNRIVLALGQMQAKGKVMSQEMNQLAEVGIRAWDMLAHELGVSVSQAMEMVEHRSVTAAQGIKAILAGMAKDFGGQMENQSKTLLGVWSNIKDKITFVLQDVGKALLPWAKLAASAVMPLLEMIGSVAKAFSDLPMPIQAVVVGVAGLAAGVGPLLIVVGTALKLMVDFTASLTAFELASAAAAAEMPALAIATEGAATSIKVLNGTMEYLIGFLKVLPVLVGGAGAAFAGWKLGEWAENQYPSVHKLAEGLRSLWGNDEESVAARELLHHDIERLQKALSAAGVGYMAASRESEKYRDYLIDLASAHDVWNKASAESVTNLKSLSDAAKKVQEEVATHIKTVAEAKSVYEELVQARKAGLATDAEVTAAWKKYNDELNKAAPKIKEHNQLLQELEQSNKRLTDSAKIAELQYEKLVRQFQSGSVSAKQVAAAYEKWQQAQEKIDPEKFAKALDAAEKAEQKAADDRLKAAETQVKQLLDLDRQLTSGRRENAAEFAMVYGKMVDSISSSDKKLVDDLLKVDEQLVRSFDTWLSRLQAGSSRLKEVYSEIVKTSVNAMEKSSDVFNLPSEGITKTASQWDGVSKSIRDTAANYVALKKSGMDVTDKLVKRAADLKAVYDQLAQSGKKASPVDLLRVATAALDAQIAAAESAGQKIPQAQLRMLQKMEEQLFRSTHTQLGFWGQLHDKIIDIFHDLSTNIARSVVKLLEDVFTHDDNDALDKQAADLKNSLEERTKEFEQFQLDIQKQMDATRKKYDDDLQKQLDALANNLDQRRKEYNDYVKDVNKKIQQITRDNRAELQRQIGEIRKSLDQREREYQDFTRTAMQEEGRLRQAAAQELQRALDDLRHNLAQRKDEYTKFAKDSADSLNALEQGFYRDIQSLNKDSNRQLEDENTSYNRDMQDLMTQLRDAESAGDAQRTAELRQQIGRRAQDHALLVKRIQEDLAQQTNDVQREAADQRSLLRKQLDAAKTDYQAYIDEIKLQQQRVTDDNQSELRERLDDLAKALADQTQQIVQARKDAEEQILILTDSYNQQLQDQVAELQDALKKQREELDQYEADYLKQVQEITKQNREALDEELASLAKSLDDRKAEYEAYKADVLRQLAEIEAAHKSTLDRIGDMWRNLFKIAAEALTEFVVKFLVDKLIKHFLEFIGLQEKALSNSAKMGSETWADMSGDAGSGAIDSAKDAKKTGGGGGGGGGGGDLGAAAGGFLPILNAITGVVTAISSVIQNFQLAKMETSLNAIEENTRFGMIHLHTIVDKLNEYIPFLKELHDDLLIDVMGILREIRDVAKNFVSISLNIEDGSEEHSQLLGSVIERVKTFDSTTSDLLSAIFQSVTSRGNAIVDQLKIINTTIINTTTILQGQLQNIIDNQPNLLEKLLGGGGFGGLGAAIGSVISSTVGGLFTMRQEGSLNAIEHEVRYGQIHLSAILDKMNEFLPKLADLVDFNNSFWAPQIAYIETLLEGMAEANAIPWSPAGTPATPLAAGAGAPVTINFYGDVNGIDDLDTLLDRVKEALGIGGQT